jgi:iron complex transport system substrate-binding protein
MRYQDIAGGPAGGFGRRGFLIGAGTLAAAAVAGCGGESDSGAGDGAGEGWTFVDDRGVEVSLDARPERVVAYVSSAAALWDFGVHVVGAFGPQRTESGGREIQAGNMDLDAVTSVGNAWDDFNLEQFAALQPDLLVTGLTGTDMWVITPEIGEEVEKIAPIVALSEYKAPLPDVIERYGELAQALGAEPSAAGVAEAREEFQRASDELRQAIAAKPGLTVLVVYADSESVYVAKPEFFADLAYYRELGLTIVEPGGSEDYWEQLSWEQVGKYPADLILTDTRSFSLTQQQMLEYPTWRQLPAVQAGRLGPWSAEPRFNYQLATPVLRELTDVIKRA